MFVTISSDLLLLFVLLVLYESKLMFLAVSVMFTETYCIYSLQASPFMIEVYAEKCSPSLKVSDIAIGGKVLMNAVTEMIIKKVVTV